MPWPAAWRPPALLSIGHGSAFFLFSYLALLNGGALLLLALHPWKRVAWAALLGTAVYYIGWTLSEDDPARLLVTVFSRPVLSPLCRVPFLIVREPHCAGPFFPIAFPIANAAATWVALMVLFGASPSIPCRPWVTVALALACLLMVAAPARRLRLPFAPHLGLGIFFVTVAVPLQFHGDVVTLCWLGESLVLVAVGQSRLAASHARLRDGGADPRRLSRSCWTGSPGRRSR